MFKDVKKYHKALVGVFIVALVVAIGSRIIKGRTYYSNIGINLVVVGENEVVIVGVTKKEESLVWVELPVNLRVDGYPAVSIWGLGEIEDRSEELVKKSIGEGLELWVQAVLKVDGEEVTVDNLLKRLLSFKSIENLNWLDRYVLYKDISGLEAKGVVLETSLPYQVTDKIQDVDGYEWLELNEAVFVWSRDLWPKEEVMNLGVTAEVINVSNESGRARKRAKQLESIGFRVVKVEAEDVEIDGGCLVKIGSDMRKENEMLGLILEDYLNCEVKEFEAGDEYFGEVVFFVGE